MLSNANNHASASKIESARSKEDLLAKGSKKKKSESRNGFINKLSTEQANPSRTSSIEVTQRGNAGLPNRLFKNADCSVASLAVSIENSLEEEETSPEPSDEYGISDSSGKKQKHK